MNAECFLCGIRHSPSRRVTCGYYIEVVDWPVPLCEEHSQDRPYPVFSWSEEMDREWTARRVLSC